MAPSKKDHSKDLRSLIIKHHQNGDSHLEVSSKVLLPRETIRHSPKIQGDQMHRYLFGRGRKRKTTVAMDRLIVHKIKSNRRLSADKVKVEIESELQTTNFTKR